MLFGILLPLLQAIRVKSIHYQVFLLLSSSGNRVLLVLLFEGVSFLYLLFLYIILMYMVLAPVNCRGLISVSYEMVFLIMGFPGGLPFFIKISSMYLIFNIGGLVVLLVLLFFVLNLAAGFNMVLYSYKLPFNSPKSFMPFFFYFVVVFLL